MYLCRDVRAKRLAHYLQPLKNKENTTQGPFIFSSLSSRQKKPEEGWFHHCVHCKEKIIVFSCVQLRCGYGSNANTKVF